MVAFTNYATTIFRDYSTDGVPASGAFSPVKADIRTWGGEIEDLLDGTTVNDGLQLSFNGSTATAALLDDATDNTKQISLDLSGITTATVRAWAFPDASDTFVGLATAQTLTNKTLTSPVISGGTVTGGTISGAAISGGTLASATASGLTVNTSTLNSPTIASGALSGTFTGGPTLSGNLTFSGNPSFTGTPTFTSVQFNAIGIGQAPGGNELMILGASPTVRLTDSSDSTFGTLNYNNGVLYLNADNGSTFTGTSAVLIRGATNNIAKFFDNGKITLGGSGTPACGVDMGSYTDAILLPGGTLAQQPTASVGMARYNSDYNVSETYQNGYWATLGNPVAIFTSTRSSGVGGGNTTSGSWQTYPLNTTPSNKIWGSSRTGSVVSLGPGTYEVEATCQNYISGPMNLRLRDTTHSTTLVAGGTSHAGSSSNSSDISLLMGKFTLTATSNIELQYYCTSSQTNGLGYPLASGENNIFGTLKITRMSTA